jgi:Heterokaryon incompatibility protein (HET)
MSVTNYLPVFNHCCDKCQEVFREIRAHSANLVHSYDHRPKHVKFHNIQALIWPALDDCHLCNLIMVELDPEKIHELLEDLITNPENAWAQTRVSLWLPDANGSLIIRLEESRLLENSFQYDILCEFAYQEIGGTTTSRTLLSSMFLASSIVLAHKCRLLTLITDRRLNPMPPSTESFETFKLIHHWLRICDNDHEDCIQRVSAHRWRPPTQLLYVGAFRPEPIVQLRESQMLQPGFIYVTLSHCWGLSNRLRLTSALYENFVDGLNLDILPKTFRDAVALTKCLGVDYLWIDSMCIIQDSMPDWKRECLLMSDVYGGAFLKIAANAYFTPNGGLFQTRNPLSVMPIEAELTQGPGDGIQRRVAISAKGEILGHLQVAPLSPYLIFLSRSGRRTSVSSP